MYCFVVVLCVCDGHIAVRAAVSRRRKHRHEPSTTVNEGKSKDYGKASV